MRKAWYLLPLAVFVVIVAFFAKGFDLNPREIPSPLINKPVPEFKLTQLSAPAQEFSPEQMRGKVWMLNVWASWCVACRIEHPVLVNLARRGDVLIYGLNYKDERDDALQWLARFGNPYRESAQDPKGQVGIDLGVYGVPETFIIDKEGIIRYKQIGPITEPVLNDTILPLMRKLGA